MAIMAESDPRGEPAVVYVERHVLGGKHRECGGVDKTDSNQIKAITGQGEPMVS